MAGRALPPPSPFAGDDGAADPALAAALGACAGRPGVVADVVAALALARVLVPVVALEEGPAGPDVPVDEQREASAGVVAVAAPDGRTALPVFSSVAALTAWRPEARPVPAEGPRAAAAALQEGWEVLVVDPGGASVVVPRPAVVALATGTAWRPAVVHDVLRPEVRDAVVAALAELDDVVTVTATPGRRAEVAVLLELRPGLSRAELDGLLAAVGERLAARVGDVVDTLELTVSGAGAAPPGR